MSNNHYKEQKMLIENFRRWQNEEITEQKDMLNEEMMYDLVVAFQDISFSKVLLDSLFDIFKAVISIGGSMAIAYRAIGPWMKIVSETPSGQAAIKKFPIRGDELLQAIQSANENNVLQAIRAFGATVKETSIKGYYCGVLVYLVAMMAYFPFSSLLGLGVGSKALLLTSAEIVRAAGKGTAKAQSIVSGLRGFFGKAKAAEKEELEKTKNLIARSLEAAGATAKEIENILDKPELYDKSLEQPEEIPPEMRVGRKSKVQKVDIPAKKTTPAGDEDADQ